MALVAGPFRGAHIIIDGNIAVHIEHHVGVDRVIMAGTNNPAAAAGLRSAESAVTGPAELGGKVAAVGAGLRYMAFGTGDVGIG